MGGGYGATWRAAGDDTKQSPPVPALHESHKLPPLPMTSAAPKPARHNTNTMPPGKSHVHETKLTEPDPTN